MIYSEQMITAGYDLGVLCAYGIQIPIRMDMLKMAAISGGTGSGKSTAISYWLFKMRHMHIDLYIADFKASGDFTGYALPDHYAVGEACYDLVSRYYNSFSECPEGGYQDGRPRLLLIDELNGLVSHLAMTKDKDGKDLKKDRLLQMVSSILSMGRSRRHICWLCTQRFSASNLFGGAATGSLDNLVIKAAFGILGTEARKSLFGGFHFDGEDELPYGIGRGLIMSDTDSLRGIIIPKVDKKRLVELYHV